MSGRRLFRVVSVYLALMILPAVFAAAQSAAPAWVLDPGAVYPPDTWIYAVDQGRTKKEAEAAALDTLAGTFRIDIKSAAKSREDFAMTSRAANNNNIEALYDSNSFSIETETASSVTGLIGVKTDVWTDKNGVAHVIARMNIPESARRYRAMIQQNAAVIDDLVADAESAVESGGENFAAYEAITTAHALAVITDNYQAILEVLDSAAADHKPAYGGAARLQKRAREIAGAIVIAVNVSVEGIDDERSTVKNRVTRAFTSYFKKHGFTTNTQGAGTGTYACDVVVSFEPVEQKGANVYVRCTLLLSLADENGDEVFTFSRTERRGHKTEKDARQVALRELEKYVTSDKKIKEGFAAKFNEYLASLL